MKKIGIISELNLENVNYGNRLQSYALNKYLNDQNDVEAKSLLVYDLEIRKYTKKIIIETIKSIIRTIKRKYFSKKNNFVASRRDLCNIFTKKNTQLIEYKNRNQLYRSDFDSIIVGSDVVWSQFPNGINRLRFLDFELPKKFKRISYAASFGRNMIPNENKSTIAKCLNKFHAISVREKSSLQLLEELDIKKCEHVCDPTLLLEKEEWEQLEKKPNFEIKNKYIFVYLLGKNLEDRKKIEQLAKKEELIIINIPNADGKTSTIDNKFGDIAFNDCSPENWLWLIHNAEYFITDSFHGTIFATIFNKKFVVTKRECGVDINIRMQDFLKKIEQEDKFVDLNNTDNFNSLTWNYERINDIVSDFKKHSKDFLEKALDLK